MIVLLKLLKKILEAISRNTAGGFFVMCCAYWCYSRGYQKADTSWKFQWAQRDLTDATTALQREVTERAKEQRRQHAADEERKRADEELAKIQAGADAAKRARGGLQQQFTEIQRQLATSETGRLSALAAASRQKPRPEYCSPSCLAKLTIWRESSQKRLMSVMSPEVPASAPTTK